MHAILYIFFMYVCPKCPKCLIDNLINLVFSNLKCSQLALTLSGTIKICKTFCHSTSCTGVVFLCKKPVPVNFHFDTLLKKLKTMCLQS